MRYRRAGLGFLIVLAVLAVLPLERAQAVEQARAMELGVQDDGRLRTDPAAVYGAGRDVGATWLRIIVAVDDPSGPRQIRAAKAHGFKVLLTIGGTGTRTPKPSAKALLRYLRTLPRADRYTVVNEVDLSGMAPCTYRRVWMAVRHALGTRLLYGDFSPVHPLTYTRRVMACHTSVRQLPFKLGFALHPYANGDPLAPGRDEGSIGNLGRVTRSLHKLGLRPEIWLDEFSYVSTWGVTDAQAAWMWPRALTQAMRHRVRMLGIYMASGPTWDSRPREQAWCVLARRCPAPSGSAPPSMPFGGGENAGAAAYSY